MPYKYDIFISYRRHPETLAWIKDHFVPLLELRVGLALGYDPAIYVHQVRQQVPAGTVWPSALGEELGLSRILVPLWTKTFFNSKWCTKELSYMLGRERETGAREKHNKYGLVVPAIIHDGDDFPSALNFIQCMDLKSCYNTRMRRDSAKAEELSDLIEVHAEGIAEAIRRAPKWKKSWPHAAADEFFSTFYSADYPRQTRIPKFQLT